MAKLGKVARYGVDGYGRQDIYRDDEGGEFVYHDDFKAVQQRAEAAEAKLEEVIRLVIYTGEMSRSKHEALEAYLCETMRNIKVDK